MVVSLVARISVDFENLRIYGGVITRGGFIPNSGDGNHREYMRVM